MQLVPVLHAFVVLRWQVLYDCYDRAEQYRLHFVCIQPDTGVFAGGTEMRKDGTVAAW